MWGLFSINPVLRIWAWSAEPPWTSFLLVKPLSKPRIEVISSDQSCSFPMWKPHGELYIYTYSYGYGFMAMVLWLWLKKACHSLVIPGLSDQQNPEQDIREGPWYIDHMPLASSFECTIFLLYHREVLPSALYASQQWHDSSQFVPRLITYLQSTIPFRWALPVELSSNCGYTYYGGDERKSTNIFQSTF